MFIIGSPKFLDEGTLEVVALGKPAQKTVPSQGFTPKDRVQQGSKSRVIFRIFAGIEAVRPIEASGLSGCLLSS